MAIKYQKILGKREDSPDVVCWFQGPWWTCKYGNIPQNHQKIRKKRGMVYRMSGTAFRVH